jgi:flagellar hook-length control protein FliK
LQQARQGQRDGAPPAKAHADATKKTSSERRGETAKADKANKTDKADKADKANKTDKADQAHKTDKADQADQAHKTDQADQADKVDQAGEADRGPPAGGLPSSPESDAALTTTTSAEHGARSDAPVQPMPIDDLLPPWLTATTRTSELLPTEAGGGRLPVDGEATSPAAAAGPAHSAPGAATGWAGDAARAAGSSPAAGDDDDGLGASLDGAVSGRREALAPAATASPQAAVPGAVAAGAAAAPAGLAPAASADAPALPEHTLHTPLHSPGFAPALGAQLTLLIKDGVTAARLHLNPAEMGPISVQIQLDGSQARIEMAAEMAATRQILEQSMPALAGALRDSGLTLSGGGVFEQAARQGQPGADQSRQGGESRPGGSAASASGAVEVAARPVALSRGVVDVYA